MNLVRPNIDRIEGYMPGEQPQEAGWIKLNTNENPYPPSPRVVAAIKKAAEGRLNVYPDPLATRFRRLAGELFGVDPDGILPANGSDENLTILMRTFADPGELVSYPYPSYILYETLADLQGARHERLLLNTDWSWNHAANRAIVEQSKLVFVPNPNSPSGNQWEENDLLQLVPPRGVLVVDQAYEDFSTNPAGPEILKRPEGRRIIVTRSLSKSYSLAGVRFGFAIADPGHVFEMRKVKDSYNCNMLSLAAATAALEDQEWMRDNRERIRGTRDRLTRELRELGLDVVESEANFVWATQPGGKHREIYEALKSRRVLIRYLSFPDVDRDVANVPTNSTLPQPLPKREESLDGLRISIGTDDDVDRFLQTLQTVLPSL